MNRIGNRRMSREAEYDEPEPDENAALGQGARRGAKDEGLMVAAQMLLNWAAVSDISAARAGALLEEEDMPVEAYKEVLNTILREKEVKGKVLPASVLNRYLEDEVQSKEVAAIFSKGFSEDTPAEEKARILTESLRRLRRERLNRELRVAETPAEIQRLAKERQKINTLTISPADV